MATESALVECRDLTVHFPIDSWFPGRARETVHAVDAVSLELRSGETFGLVGESGCGKSTLGRALIRLVEPTAGKVIFDGHDLGTMGGNELRQVRRDMQIVFQDPFGSLDPRQSVAQIVGEPLRAHGLLAGQALAQRVAELLRLVGLDPALGGRRPHQFSGGQRQRISIARAIAPGPRFIVADEAVSALDVSVQSQILNLLMDLQAQLGLTYLFIAHGLNVVRHVSDTVGVMYLGQLVEVAPTDELFAGYAHPYTAALISAIPPPDPGAPRDRIVLSGEVPSAVRPPSGCRFRTRCPLADQLCADQVPELGEIRPGHRVACHHPISARDLPSLAKLAKARAQDSPRGYVA